MTLVLLYSKTSVGRTRIGQALLMARTDLKDPSIFLLFLTKKKPFHSNTDYFPRTVELNEWSSVNYEITSFTMPNLNITI
jgi:lipopolysaccharide biosynthesis glycosyltransferase